MNSSTRAFVYILSCNDDAYYVGIHRGDDVMVRVNEHNLGLNPKAWTYLRRPVELVWSAYFEQTVDAIACEIQLKRWSRAKKEALISGDIPRLKKLAHSRTAPADPTKRKPWLKDRKQT